MLAACCNRAVSDVKRQCASKVAHANELVRKAQASRIKSQALVTASQDVLADYKNQLDEVQGDVEFKARVEKLERNAAIHKNVINEPRAQNAASAKLLDDTSALNAQVLLEN